MLIDELANAQEIKDHEVRSCNQQNGDHDNKPKVALTANLNICFFKKKKKTKVNVVTKSTKYPIGKKCILIYIQLLPFRI